MSELSGLSTSMLLNILRTCTDSRVQRGRELAYVRTVREAVEEALAERETQRRLERVWDHFDSCDAALTE